MFRKVIYANCKAIPAEFNATISVSLAKFFDETVCNEKNVHSQKRGRKFFIVYKLQIKKYSEHI